jgi:hypothetical protein
MKNDPAFKLLAVVIIAGIILAFASPKSPNGVQLTSTTHASVAAVSYHS